MALLGELYAHDHRSQRRQDNEMDLTTRYMGLELKNPLVASSSPLTGNLDDIRRLEDAGAAAVVLPSLFEERIDAEVRAHEVLTATGLGNVPESPNPFPESEGPGSEQYLDLIRRAVTAVDIPIVASLNGTTDEGWTGHAKLIEQAGATALELNVYLIPTDLALTGSEVEQSYLEVLRQVRRTVALPLAIKLGPYFSSIGQIAAQFAAAGADALVLFNRFYQPDIDLADLRLRNDLQLSNSSEIGLPLLWIALLCGRVDASLAASTGVENSEQVAKYLLAGADIVMTTAALLRHGPQHMKALLTGTISWLAAREIESLDEIRGLLSQHRFTNPDSFGRQSYVKILRDYAALHPHGAV